MKNEIAAEQKNDRVSINKDTQLKKKSLLKCKIKGLINLAGRNNTGKITAYHKGGGHKRKYRALNFNRMNTSKGIVCSIEYDPNRAAYIASVYDVIEGTFFYMLAPKRTGIGDIVESGPNVDPRLGNSLPIESMPLGSYMHSVSPTTKKPAQISRSAGAFSKLKEKTPSHVVIELSSGEHRSLAPSCYATLGIVSNEFKFLKKLYKAGQSRWLNKRPTVRGVAMNPIDHPHGGGEGKKSKINKTPWGKYNNRGSTSRSKNKNTIKK